jgi:hypothetical protein
MAKPTTELAKRSKPPPYTHWDQRGEQPVLLSDLNLIDSDRKCKRLSFQTDDPEIAKRYMRLLVPSLVAQGRLSADSGAAKVYRPERNERSRLKKFDTEIRRIKALSQPKYGPAALAIAKRRSLPVGIIYCLAGRKPATSPGTFATRRMRARVDGKRLPIGDTWEHHAQGGKCFYSNHGVLTARIHIDSRRSQWPLKVYNEEEAEALMAPVRAARERLQQAANETLNYELGTKEAVAAAAARTEARVQLARAIIKARGPKKLVAVLLKGRAERRTMKLAAQEDCVKAYMKLIEASPDGATVPRAFLEKKMMKDFDVGRDDARKARAEAIRLMRPSFPPDSKWDQPGAPGK